MRLVATAADAGQRLDLWLARCLPDCSRSRVQALIRDGHATVDGRAAKPGLRVAAGLVVEAVIPPAAPVDLAPEDIPLRVIHEDRDIIVIDKQVGLVVHPAAGHGSGTLVNALLHHCADLAGVGGERRPGIVHRLDKDTSGAMVAAKNEGAMQGLVRQFQSGEVRKTYLALVRAVPSPPSGRIETLIGRSPHDRKKMSVRPAGGRVAVTHYEVVESFGDCALLRVRIETGRTHQIRVHLAHLGHPVLGDRQYGRAGAAAPRQMLHAWKLELTHPASGRAMSFTAEIPADMAALLRDLRAGSLTLSPPTA